ncbi:hypothetical protein BIY37_12550 [Candidatus Brocadia sapporoensis]|uniref:Uncharacterized protein n=1 Tax=Candidatus Brocadia sapporoensis TaxID=392547 RepID=A0A1V6LX08_9BACT|nr:hypothetical protein [Candidatus Brocadia sapporoensis]MDG6006518.1 hypothetical protein [Candidatus Brocadia sp.]OQD44672.1 hypothetical protein BIY37_12550 [Candidatus Brocadia sapporoensis]GJQ22221.1 MAG: hypothetical protein HBSAPP01_00110 [Candidatus Brocadia sapporoensis]
MKAFSTVLGMISGLALLAVLLAGGYFLFKYVVNIFDTLGPQYGTIAAIASIVVVLCAVIIAGGLRARCTNEGLSVKSNVYERLVVFLSDLLRRNTTGEEGQADEGELIKLEQLLVLYGGPKVITTYLKIRRKIRDEKKEGSETMALLNKLVLAMRADLGRRELNLKEKDILDLLLGRS